MTDHGGVLRSREGMDLGAKELAVLAERSDEAPGVDAWETTNLATVGSALLGAARLREETRGSHWREDFPDRDDEHWSRHIDVRLEGGTLVYDTSTHGASTT